MRTSEDLPKTKQILLREDSPVTEELIGQLETLLEFASPEELNRDLRDAFTIFISKNHEAYPYDLPRFAENFYALFRFFDVAGRERSQMSGQQGNRASV